MARWCGAVRMTPSATVRLALKRLRTTCACRGRYFDAETGLYYNLNRYYDPKTGRYLQPDPAGDGLNPYTYVGGNPVNAIDPEGLCALRMLGGIGEIKLGLAATAFTSGAASVAAWAAIANGFDNFIAGARGLGGEQKQAGLEWVMHKLIPNKTIANLAYIGTQFAIPYAAAKLAAWEVNMSVFSRTDDMTVQKDFFLGRTGHLGFSFNRGKKILGFGPVTPKGFEDDLMIQSGFMKRLIARETFAGKLTIDTAKFVEARALGLPYKEISYQVGFRQYWGARIGARLDRIKSILFGSIAGKSYRFPIRGQAFPEGIYNCVTYPTSLGLPTPASSGYISHVF